MEVGQQQTWATVLRWSPHSATRCRGKAGFYSAPGPAIPGFRTEGAHGNMELLQSTGHHCQSEYETFRLKSQMLWPRIVQPRQSSDLPPETIANGQLLWANTASSSCWRKPRHWAHLPQSRWYRCSRMAGNVNWVEQKRSNSPARPFWQPIQDHRMFGEQSLKNDACLLEAGQSWFSISAPGPGAGYLL